MYGQTYVHRTKIYTGTVHRSWQYAKRKTGSWRVPGITDMTDCIFKAENKGQVVLTKMLSSVVYRLLSILHCRNKELFRSSVTFLPLCLPHGKPRAGRRPQVFTNMHPRYHNFFLQAIRTIVPTEARRAHPI